jgi:hypothetical protein
VSPDGGAVGAVSDIDFGDPDDPANTDPNVKYADAINALTQASALPDIVVLLGETQAVTHVLAGLESNWPAAARRPQYVVSNGLQTKELLDLVASAPALRTRILGTAAGSDSSSYKDWSRFLVRFRQTFPDAGAVPETFGVAQAYDAFYTIALAASLTRNTDLNGTDIAKVLTTQMFSTDGGPTATIDIGPDQIQTAFRALAAGRQLSLFGASAQLAFEPSGDLVTNIQVWCILPGQAGQPFVFQTSGLAYSPDAGVLEGSILDACSN